MAILLLITGLILVSIALLLVGRPGQPRRASALDRFKNAGPDEVKRGKRLRNTRVG